MTHDRTVRTHRDHLVLVNDHCTDRHLPKSMGTSRLLQCLTHEFDVRGRHSLSLFTERGVFTLPATRPSSHNAADFQPRELVKGPAYRSQKQAGPRTGTGSVSQWVVFTLNSARYALPLIAVERIVQAAQITPLPGAPHTVLGVLNVQGSVLPVFSLRRRFGLPERAVDVDDQFLIARTAHRRVALVIDAAQEVIEHPPAAIVDTQRLANGLEQIQGVIPLEGNMLLIQDLEKLLSQDDAVALDKAMKDASRDR